MCAVPSSDRRRRFLQYNFVDPGWGGAEFPTGAGPPSPAGAGAALPCELDSRNVLQSTKSQLKTQLNK